MKKNFIRMLIRYLLICLGLISVCFFLIPRAYDQTAKIPVHVFIEEQELGADGYIYARGKTNFAQLPALSVLKALGVDVSEMHYGSVILDAESKDYLLSDKKPYYVLSYAKKSFILSEDELYDMEGKPLRIIHAVHLDGASAEIYMEGSELLAFLDSLQLEPMEIIFDVKGRKVVLFPQGTREIP